MKKLLVSLLLLLSIVNLVGCWRKPERTDVEEDPRISQEELAKQKHAIEARKERKRQRDAEKEAEKEKRKREKALAEKEERERQKEQQQELPEEQQQEQVIQTTKQEKVQQAIDNYRANMDSALAITESFDNGMNTSYDISYNEETDEIYIYFYLTTPYFTPKEVIEMLKTFEAKDTVMDIAISCSVEKSSIKKYLKEQGVSVSYIYVGYFSGTKYSIASIDTNYNVYFVNPYMN
ncbi:hypothetical protein LQE93_16475 [Clostridium sp. NSJ-145]|uniref:hypothetical protein n=1 Tax=Clostridium sp. NSJ-145 TaxID=2897777 RepID=UPI001E50D274|nr:hypothetical protein [Clostridium sp. NSJ-145]MCD2503326.1 hypothetical protein [Clostridium sp. NSJ-145]